MCGIWATLGKKIVPEKAKELLAALVARGPEGSRILEGDRQQLGFTRLAINGLNEEGMQPFQGEGLRWICNGEIQNHADLKSRFGIETKSGSDCEVLGGLWRKLGSTTDAKAVFRALDGVFACVIIDEANKMAQVARDPQGVRPLFVGYATGDDNQTVVSIQFASEMKALSPQCSIIESFPPGHQAAYSINEPLQRIGFEPQHTIPWLKNPAQNDITMAAQGVKAALEAAVQKRMMTERPVAALLSGGLDSSLIAALVQRELKAVGAPNLRTFSIGFEGSKDLYQARKVAEHIGSEHEEVVLTPDDFWNAIPEVIRAIETQDITSVRASVGNYLVSREIRRRSECKVVFNGDGSDEVLGGYLQFHNAPSHEEFEAETERLLKDIHFFDVLRSDRSISSHGLEARTPFLDKQFVSVARSVATALRRPVKGAEKWILRKAFEGSGLLPDEVLWRRKEAFSDGVSGAEKSWQEICKERAEAEVGSDWEKDAAKVPGIVPTSAEAFYYRTLFNRFYPKAAAKVVPQYWLPRWCGNATDPSARTLQVQQAVEATEATEAE